MLLITELAFTIKLHFIFIKNYYYSLLYNIELLYFDINIKMLSLKSRKNEKIILIVLLFLYIQVLFVCLKAYQLLWLI